MLSKYYSNDWNESKEVKKKSDFFYHLHIGIWINHRILDLNETQYCLDLNGKKSKKGGDICICVIHLAVVKLTQHSKATTFQ